MSDMVIVPWIKDAERQGYKMGRDIVYCDKTKYNIIKRPVKSNDLVFEIGCCQANACRIALKFKRLNPKVRSGYRMKAMPSEKEEDTPHFWVEMNGKVWDVLNTRGAGMVYVIWDIEDFYECYGIELHKEWNKKLDYGGEYVWHFLSTVKPKPK